MLRPYVIRLARLNSHHVAPTSFAPLHHSHGAIQFPPYWIVPNVPTYTIEIRAITNDSIEIIALPNPRHPAAAYRIDSCRDRRFERSHNGAERSWAYSPDCVSTRGARIEEQDSMHMVRHDHEFVCVNVQEMIRKIRPNIRARFRRTDSEPFRRSAHDQKGVTMRRS